MEKTIQEAVAEKIAKSGENVANIVVDKLADLEINKRVDAITKAVNKQDAMEKDLKKINKNDVFTYADGNPIEAMSKNRFEEIKKLKEKMDKLSKAIDSALTQNSSDAYNKLDETLKKLDNVGNDKKEGSTESKSE